MIILLTENISFIKNLDDKFEGIYGEISPNKVKGFCKICNQESDTSLFLNKTKHNKSSGTYTKRRLHLL